jgi:hypothetical protein
MITLEVLKEYLAFLLEKIKSYMPWNWSKKSEVSAIFEANLEDLPIESENEEESQIVEEPQIVEEYQGIEDTTGTSYPNMYGGILIAMSSTISDSTE